MAVEIVKGDLFEFNAQLRLITTNTKGAMGAGIAKQYRDLNPEGYLRYKDRCKAGLYRVDSLLLQKHLGHWWCLFPTKDDWRYPSKLIWVERNLKKLLWVCETHNVTSVAMPLLGCLNGGLESSDVIALIERTFQFKPIKCSIVVR